VSARKGGLSCREDQVWAALEEVWVVPEKEWAVRVAPEAVAWEDQWRQVRVANASACMRTPGAPWAGCAVRGDEVPEMRRGDDAGIEKNSEL